jgi:hypothetical protein
MSTEWLTTFLGKYASMKLNNTYLEKNETSFPVTSVCSDKRRMPTVRKYLSGLKLIDDCSYYTLHPVDEEVEKLLPGSTEEPAFDLTAKKSKSQPLDTPTEGYKGIHSFTSKELIHIYLNQKDYDFNVVISLRNKECRDLRVFRKSLITSLDDNIITNHIEKYALEHVQEILREAFRVKIQALHNHQYVYITNDEDPLPYDSFVYNTTGVGTHFNNEDVFGEKDLSDRIEKVSELVRFFGRALKELLVLQRHCQKMGSDKFREHILNTCRTHLQDMAPMWMTDDDRDKRDIALMVLKGTSAK